MVRLTPDEAQTVRIAATMHGLSISEYVRRTSLGYELPAVPHLVVVGHAFKDLAGAANNLNQIAHRLNESRGAEEAGPVDEALAVLRQTHQAVEALRGWLMAEARRGDS